MYRKDNGRSAKGLSFLPAFCHKNGILRTAVLAAMLVFSLLVSACQGLPANSVAASLTDSARSDAAPSDRGAVSGGQSAVPESGSVSPASAPDKEATAPGKETTAPGKAEAPAEAVDRGDAFRAYANILWEVQWIGDAFPDDAQYIFDNTSGTALYLYDLTGDGVEELILIARGSVESEGWYAIYTYVPDGNVPLWPTRMLTGTCASSADPLVRKDRHIFGVYAYQGGLAEYQLFLFDGRAPAAGTVFAVDTDEGETFDKTVAGSFWAGSYYFLDPVPASVIYEEAGVSAPAENSSDEAGRALAYRSYLRVVREIQYIWDAWPEDGNYIYENGLPTDMYLCDVTGDGIEEMILIVRGNVESEGWYAVYTCIPGSEPEGLAPWPTVIASGKCSASAEAIVRDDADIFGIRIYHGGLELYYLFRFEGQQLAESAEFLLDNDEGETLSDKAEGTVWKGSYRTLSPSPFSVLYDTAETKTEEAAPSAAQMDAYHAYVRQIWEVQYIWDVFPEDGNYIYENSSGMDMYLYDLDGDGVEELIIIQRGNVESEGWYAVCTYIPVDGQGYETIYPTVIANGTCSASAVPMVRSEGNALAICSYHGGLESCIMHRFEGQKATASAEFLVDRDEGQSLKSLTMGTIWAGSYTTITPTAPQVLYKLVGII